MSLITERRVAHLWGLAGGNPGSPGENRLWPAGDERRRVRLAAKATLPLEAGDAVQLLTPGGGGWARSRPVAKAPWTPAGPSR